MSVAGTRDFLPKEMELREWLFNKWKTVAKSFGFKQYDTPVVESTNIYTRKGGDDIINEMFLLADKVLCLRPELTPSLVRIASNMDPKTYTYPLRLYTIGQCWRYETITKNRKREHYQFNCDIVSNTSDIKYESEILFIIINFFKSIGLSSTDIKIKISNRKYINNILTSWSINNENILKIFNIIDKINKKTKEEIIQDLTQYLSQEQITDLFISLNSDTNDSDINELLMYLKEEKEWFEVDYTLVRGLSYYTGIVFEAFSINTDNKRSICGGGRYDNLFKNYGFKNYSTVGFGMGDVVILEILSDLNKLPILDENIDYLVIPYTNELYNDCVKIGSDLRSKNKSVEVYVKKGKIKLGDIYAYANKIKVNYVILVASEWENKQIVIKDMKAETTTQSTLYLSEFLNSLSLLD